jgi:phosphate transport system substrate-binding protein
MTRVLLMAAISLVCAVVIGSAAPPVSGGPGASDQAAHQADTARPRAEGDADGTRVLSDALPPYEPVAGLSGKITSIGDSTTTNVVARVATEFRRIYPDVTLKITASLTSIGPSALLEGRADMVPMSRALTPEEVQGFTSKYGYPPTEIKVAADALAIYVEKRNPMPSLTVGQLDGIFSRTQRRGGNSIETWGQAGLTGEWADRPITLYGYSPEDGAHQIFQQQVLDGGQFRLSLLVLGGGSSIVQGVAADPGAIGYASIFFTCKRVHPVPIAGADGRLYAPTAENVRGHRYPLSRFLYICVNKPPGQPLGGPAAEFLRFLLSREGQQIVAADGNIPLDAATVDEGRQALAQLTGQEEPPTLRAK